MFAMSPTTNWASFPHVSLVCKRAIRSPFWKSPGVSNSLSISKASDYLLGRYKMEAMINNIRVSPKCTVPFSPFIPGVPGLPSEPGTPGMPGMPGMAGGPVQLLWAQETWSKPSSSSNRGVETSPHHIFISSA